jgi:NitT/TauT family transport system permease protein
MPHEPTPLRNDLSGRAPDDELLTSPAATAVLEDAAAAVAGLDALDTPTTTTRPWWRRALSTGLPPLVALVLFLLVWQLVWASAITDEYKVPAPAEVWHAFAKVVDDGSVFSILWTSVSRAFIGFAVGLVVATPLGLLVAKVRVVRAAIGPLLQGLQSLPSVAWVPAAVLWFGLTDATIYFVVLAGSIPSIANGLVAGIDQIPPILPRVGQVLGARGLTSARHILLPAALPGYLAGCKQGWAFSWRSLMAAEIIAAGPLLGFGLGAYLKQGSDFNDMPSVVAAIFLILIVGIGIELLVFRPVERRVLHARGLALGS